MSASRRTTALVLRARAQGESDRLLTLCSPDLGRFTAIAKGALKSRRRFVNKLEPFTLLKILYRPPARSSLFFLSEAELVNAHLSLRTDYDRYVAAALIVELLERFSSEQDPDPGVFALTCWSLGHLSRDMRPAAAALLFLLRLLDLCGYRPRLDHCRHCARPLNRHERLFLDPANGSLSCALATHRNGSSLSLSVQTLGFLNQAQQMRLNRLNRLLFPELVLVQGLTALIQYSRHLLQQDIHSWKQARERLFTHRFNPVPLPSRTVLSAGR